MTAVLSDPITLILLIAISSVRTAVALLMLPMLATTIVPGLVRGALGFALIVPVVAATLEKPFPLEFTALSILLLFLREGAVGVVIGLGYGAFCAGLQAVGEIIDHQTGLTFTQNLDPVRGNNVSVTSILLQSLLFAVLMYSGFLLLVTDTIYLSFEVWPIGQVMPAFAGGIPLRLVSESSRLFSLALLLSGPVVLVLFVEPRRAAVEREQLVSVVEIRRRHWSVGSLLAHHHGAQRSGDARGRTVHASHG
jgi:type III secretory pathway component EscT